MTGFKRRQIVVLSLVLMIVVAGYLQYTYKKSSSSLADDEKGKLGEAVYVDGMDLTDKNSELVLESNNSKAIKASQEVTDFFSQSKLQREIAISRDSDELKAISEDANASGEIRELAYEKMIRLVENSEKEMRIEILVKERGFEDVICLFSEDGSVDVVIKAPSLTSTDVAKISDIVSRHAEVDMTSIHVSHIY